MNRKNHTQEELDENRAAADAAAYAECWVNHYFEITDEGKTTYINKLKGK